jgi:hypothetical protein
MPSVEISDVNYMILTGIAELNKMTVETLIQSAVSKLIRGRIQTTEFERECQSPNCLNRFNATQYRRRYCSKACAMNERYRISNIRRRKEKRTATCSECEKTFYTKHDAIRTCSEVCKHRRANRLTREGYRRNHAPRAPETLTCIVCHHDFETLNRNTKMCSAKCRRARRIELDIARGEKPR